MQSQHINIAWVPCNPELANNQLFNISAVRDAAIERFVKAHQRLSDKGFTSQTVDQCDLTQTNILIFYAIGSELSWVIKAIKANPSIQLLNIPIEPPVVACLHEQSILTSMPFERLLVWHDHLAAKGLPFVKANIGEAVIDSKSIPSTPFTEKKFLVAITSSKCIKHPNGIHHERFRAFEFFSQTKDTMDLYGIGWDKTNASFLQAIYRGTCETKKDVLQHYKFSICFENAKNYPGLITEKIFDCFAAGVVPIYYGPPNVLDYIPQACFINVHDFAGYDALYPFLSNMGAHEYQAYLDAVKAFIQTQAYYEFTSERFSEIILEQVQSLLAQPKPHRTVFGFKYALLKIVCTHPLLFFKNFKQCRRFLFELLFCFGK